MKRLLSFYSPKAPLLFVYMLQQFEYKPGKFFKWVLSLPNLFTVQKRGRLQLTARAKVTVLLAYAVWLGVLLLGIVPAFLHAKYTLLVVCLTAPFITAIGLFISSSLLQMLVVNPSQRGQISHAKNKLKQFQAARIAVLGSYGKTTMKELLLTVLSQGKKVAATPGNKNVLISHARWVNQLQGDEEVLIFEYGEGAPGDIARLADFSQPTQAIVTGLAPAHLDEYTSLEAIADDFASIIQVVSPENIFVHDDSNLLKQKMSDCVFYSEQGIGDWHTSDIEVDYDGTKFTLADASSKLQLKSGLLGKHQVGPLAAVVVLAKKIGLTDAQIIDGVMATKPFDHRMQARSLHGAWIIDDTYNGNIEGMRAGLELLQTLPGKKKIYVTPGLVDQGAENERVHRELGELIAKAAPDKVVLMKNSNTQFIQAGMEGYTGEQVVEANPLDYYTNLEHFLAAGDVVMLQNDLPDSYR